MPVPVWPSQPCWSALPPLRRRDASCTASSRNQQRAGASDGLQHHAARGCRWIDPGQRAAGPFAAASFRRAGVRRAAGRHGHGARRASPKMATWSTPTSVTNDKTGQKVERMPPGQADAASMQAEGPIKLRLYDPRGRLNGVMLADGTQIYLPPSAAEARAADLAPGHSLYVEGTGYAGPLGKSIAARELGADKASAATVEDMAGSSTPNRPGRHPKKAGGNEFRRIIPPRLSRLTSSDLSCHPFYRRHCRPPANHVRRLLRDHHGRGVGVRRRHHRHDGRIHHAQPIHPADP